jgi:hypothetical protein
VQGAAEVERDAAVGELGEDVAGVGQGAGEPVQLGHHELVAGTAGGHRLPQSGAGSVGAGQPVVDIDPVRSDAEPPQSLTLRGEVLPAG